MYLRVPLECLIIPSLSAHSTTSVITGLQISLPPTLMDGVLCSCFNLTSPTADTLVVLEHDVHVWGAANTLLFTLLFSITSIRMYICVRVACVVNGQCVGFFQQIFPLLRFSCYFSLGGGGPPAL